MGTSPRLCRDCGRPLATGEGTGTPPTCAACAKARPEAKTLPGRTAPTRETGVRLRPEEFSSVPFPSARALPPPGTDLGGLVIERRLGDGGMGHVLAARDPHLDRIVAVKFLRDSLVGDERAERFFRREGRALAGIAHPHVVRVFSVGAWEGWPYIVMEHVEGALLSECIRQGRLAIPLILRIAEELASALAAVHEARIVHRDVKPSNVVLRGSDGSACLLDFGIARGITDTSDSSGTFAGTPLYMAPEQVARQKPDRRVDVYGFGTTLFEMATGRVPHESESHAEFFRAVLHDDAPLLRTLRPDAPRRLESIVARALARAPELRQPDGAALLEDVRAARREFDGPSGPRTPDRVAEAIAATPPVDPSETIPLLGRDAEYAAAVRFLDGIVDRRGGLLLVEGEAGSGKSRFLREVERAARARAIGVARFAGAEFPGSPYRAVREALLQYAPELGSGGPAALVEFVARASSANAPLVPALRWLLDTGADEEAGRPGRSDLLRTFLAVVRAIAAVRPLLLAAEDAHLLDAGSLELLVAAAEQAGSWPLGVVITHRPQGERDPRSPLPASLPRLRGMTAAVALTLGPLSEDIVAEMIHRMLRIDEAEARRLAPLLHRKSSGNPLYIAEALRLLEQEKAVRSAGGRRRIRQSLTTLAIPPKLLELALRRVSGLPEAERDALGVASADPEGATSDLVARCLDCSRVKALQALQHLVSDRGLLRQDGERYRISHAEIRDAAYGALIPELRVAYHLEAAKALREAGAATDDPARLGRHLRAAGLRAEAAPHLLEAGRRLLVGHSPAEALEFFEEAEDCAGPEGLPAATVGRAQALELLGEMEPAREALERLMRAGGEAEAEALLPLAEFERNRGRHRKSLELIEKAAALPLSPDLQLRRLILEAQAHSQLLQGEAALAALRRAEAMAEGASRVRLLELWSTFGTVSWRLERFEEAKGYYEKCIPLAEDVGALYRSAILLYNIGLVSSDLGGGDEALAWVDKAIERAVLSGNHRMVVYSRILRAEIHLESLRLAPAGQALDEVAGGLDSLQSNEARCLYLAGRAELELAQDRHGAALPWIDQGLALAEESPRQRSGFRSLRARALLEAGRAEEALEEARRARADLPETGAERQVEEAVGLAARALRELAREGEERAELVRLAPSRSPVAAAERALEAADPGERARWTSVARGLARNERGKAQVDRRLGPG